MDTIKLPPFSNVGAGNLATLTTSVLFGMSAHCLIFSLGGTTFDSSHIESIRVLLDGKSVVPDITGAELQKMNDFRDLDGDTSVVRLFFGNPKATTIKGQHITDLDQSVYRTPLTVQIKIAADAVAPTLTGFARVNPPKVALGLGYTLDDAAVIKAWVRSILNPSSALDKFAADIGFGSGAGAAIERITFFNNNMTSLEVRKSGVIIHEDIPADLNEAILRDYGRVPQAGTYVWDPVADGNMGQSVTTVKPGGERYSIQLAVSTSAADTIKVYSEVATKLGLI